MSSVRKYAVIVAGGKGVRMGTDIPKQFLPLLGVPMLCHCIQAFIHTYRDINIILVAPESQLHSTETIVKSYVGPLHLTSVAGGETRFHSVQNGLRKIEKKGIVFVHDGVRPLVSANLIKRCYKQALELGSAIPVIQCTDSLRVVNEDGLSSPLNREQVRLVQTPQTFLTDIILPAFDQEYNVNFTDEATVVEATGQSIHLIEGERDNIKITNPGDMLIADTLLKSS